MLSREQTNEFKEATEEYVGLMQEAIEYKFEPDGRSAASEDDAKLDAGRRSPTALVLAGRGSEDLAVSQLVADAIRLERGIDTRCSPLGGLTGISSAAELGTDDPPEVVALVSVGTVTRAQLDILLRRLRRSFPRSHVVVGYWDGTGASPDVAEEIYCAELVSALVDLISRESDVRGPRKQTVRHLEAVAAG